MICYDADNAGRKAAQRAIPILDKLGLDIRVVTVPGAKDPDEFIKSSGAEAFRALIEDSENGMEYRLQSAAAGFDMGTDDGKVGYLKEAAGIIAALPDPVSREVYSMRVAEQCSVAVEAVRDAVNQDRRRKINTARRRRERDDTRPERQVQHAELGIRYENPRSAAAEEGVIALLQAMPELFRDGAGPAPESFTSEPLRHIYEAMTDLSRRGLDCSAAALAGSLTQEEISLYTNIIQSQPVSAANAKQALADYIHKIGSRNQGAQDVDLKAYAVSKKQTKGYGGDSHG